MEFKNKKYKLSSKLVFYFTVVILVGIITIGVVVNLIIESKFADYVSNKNEQDIINIIEDIELLYKGDIWNKRDINDIGKKALNNGMILDIYDKNKNLVWSAMKFNKKKCHQVRGNIENNMDGRYSKWSDEYREDIFELENNGENIGYINIGYYGTTYYLDSEIGFLDDINKVILIVAGILIVISIIVAILISKSIANPIAKVSEMAKIIEEGNYDNKINYESQIIEVDNLVHSINNLADNLNKQEILRKRLTTDVAHELRTPLTSIQTHLEAILDGIWEPTTNRISGINEEVVRLVSLVNKLSSLSRFESGNEKLSISKIDLSSLVENIIYNLDSDAINKNINIKYEKEQIYVNLDKEKISQVLVNLISNAIRYTEDGGLVDIKLYKDDSSIYISVKDNGIGIPEDDLKHIFERFYRVDKSRNKSTGGIGVGLTISKAIVNSHKGNIYAKSKIGEGSEFIVSIANNL